MGYLALGGVGAVLLALLLQHVAPPVFQWIGQEVRKMLERK